MTIPKSTGVEKIELARIVIGKSQMRVSDVNEGIEELAESIRKVGLLHPIVVAPTSEGKFEVIAGQRRFLALQLIGEKTIRASVLDRYPTEIEAKAISLAENIVKLDPTPKDIKAACTYFYRVYGTVRDVAEELGLPQSFVSRNVKYDRLIPELKEEVDQKGLDVNAALRAQDAATKSDGTIDPSDAVQLAKEIAPLSGVMQRKAVEKAQEDPDAPAETKIEKARQQPKVTQVIVTLSDARHRQLQSYAKTEGVTQDEAAALLIEEALSSKGFKDRPDSE